MKRNSISSQQIIRPSIRPAGMAGKPINNTNGSARSNISKPFLCPNTCRTCEKNTRMRVWEKKMKIVETISILSFSADYCRAVFNVNTIFLMERATSFQLRIV